jgi:hypothetical protein
MHCIDLSAARTIRLLPLAKERTNKKKKGKNNKKVCDAFHCAAPSKVDGTL